MAPTRLANLLHPSPPLSCTAFTLSQLGTPWDTSDNQFQPHPAGQAKGLHWYTNLCTGLLV